MRLLLPIVAPVAALMLVACHVAQPSSRAPGSRDLTPTPAPGSATASAALPTVQPADVVATLRRYAFAKEDLPAGYNIGGVVEVSNEQAAHDYADAQQALKEEADTGRRGGIGQQILPPATVVGTIGVSTEIFASPEGAKRWAIDPPPMPASLNVTSVDPGTGFGDAAAAVHWTQGGQGFYVLSFSRGRIVYGIGIAAAAGRESLAPAQELARSLDKKALSLGNN